MRVTALVDSPGHVCCRYRLAAFRPFLEAPGHHLDLLALPTNPWGWFRLGRDLRAADAVILQRRLLPGWRLRMLRRAARILLYDFDDAVFLRDSFAPKGLHSARRLGRFAAIVRQADIVVAGNAYLAGEAARWAVPGSVHQIPTCVDPDAYPLAEHARPAGHAQLVWIGSSSTLQGLERARPILERVGQRLPGLRLKLVCDRFLNLRHLPVLACPWSQAGEPAALADADIGISWIPNDLWSRGKCGLKILQYMAAGLPVVANPVGVQAEMVRHGQNGFLAETPEQWAEAIAALARDPALRRRMGAEGRRRLETDYGLTTGAARWLDLLRGLGTRRQAG